MFEELHQVKLVSFYLISRPLGFIFCKMFHITRRPKIPETTLSAFLQSVQQILNLADSYL